MHFFFWRVGATQKSLSIFPLLPASHFLKLCCSLKSPVMSCFHCHLFIYFRGGEHRGIDQGLQLCQQLCRCVIQALRLFCLSLQSHECFPDLVILIKYATFDRNRVTIFEFKCGHPPHTHTPPRLRIKADILNINDKKQRKEQRSELRLAFFNFPCQPPAAFPLQFFSSFFFQMNFMIFSSYPSLPPHSIVLPLSRSLTSRQFSPDRFHSVLEGMDLIALWGLVGCAGLGCLISVPCRNWFNAS